MAIKLRPRRASCDGVIIERSHAMDIQVESSPADVDFSFAAHAPKPVSQVEPSLGVLLAVVLLPSRSFFGWICCIYPERILARDVESFKIMTKNQIVSCLNVY